MWRAEVSQSVKGRISYLQRATHLAASHGCWTIIFLLIVLMCLINWINFPRLLLICIIQCHEKALETSHGRLCLIHEKHNAAFPLNVNSYNVNLSRFTYYLQWDWLFKSHNTIHSLLWSCAMLIVDGLLKDFERVFWLSFRNSQDTLDLGCATRKP